MPDIIREHKVPNKVIFEYLLSNCHTREEVYSYLENNLMLVAVTKEEDALLSSSGHKMTVPENGCRYEFAGVEVHGIERVTEFRV